MSYVVMSCFSLFQSTSFEFRQSFNFVTKAKAQLMYILKVFADQYAAHIFLGLTAKKSQPDRPLTPTD